jgi:hypothetical protein
VDALEARLTSNGPNCGDSPLVIAARTGLRCNPGKGAGRVAPPHQHTIVAPVSEQRPCRGGHRSARRLLQVSLGLLRGFDSPP